ncbi:hypothetical protein F4679DRAFT_592167 [Xylaria curta]|nr:hypothetical protein F4679DRAFT_592167 [Xylaria curta]
MVQRMIYLKPSAFEKSKVHIEGDSGPYLLSTFGAYMDEQFRRDPPSFKQMIDMGLTKDLWAVLEGAAVPTDWNKSVAGLIHGLSNLPDTEAVAMAPKSHQIGGSLSFTGKSGSFMASGGMFEDSPPKMLSPLSAAIRKGKARLALVIFSLHIEHEEPIIDFDQAIVLGCIYLQNDITELLLNLYDNSPHMCLYSQGPKRRLDVLTSELLSKVLIITQPEAIELERRVLHGDGLLTAYKNTLKLLFQYEADPIRNSAGPSPLVVILQNDNSLALEVLREFLEKSRVDMIQLLSNPIETHESTVSKENNVIALKLCMNYGSIKCFEYITREFPTLALDPAKDILGRTILLQACDKENGTSYVEALLRSGVDVTISNEIGETPICVELLKGNMKAVNAISRHCDTEQLQRMLGRDEESGWSILFRLLARWQSEKSIDMLESFRWLLLPEHRGFHQYGPLDVPVWYPIVGKPRPLAHVDQRLDVEVMKMILGAEGVSIKGLSEPYRNRTILNLAAFNGHFEVIKLLLDNGFDPNIGVDISDQNLPSRYKFDPRTKNMTALDSICTALTGFGVPDRYAQGSFLETQARLKDLEKIRDLLIQRGGHGLVYDDLDLEDFMEPEQLVPTEGTVHGETLSRDNNIMIGSWPKTFAEVSIPTTTIEAQILETPQTKKAKMYNIVRSIVQKKLRERKRVLVEGQVIPGDYLESLRYSAILSRHEWRLPPDWQCLALQEDTSQSNGYAVLYMNRISNKFTTERPPLFRGELNMGEKRGKEIAVEEDIYDATPVMKPQSLSSEPDPAFSDLCDTNLPDPGLSSLSREAKLPFDRRQDTDDTHENQTLSEGLRGSKIIAVSASKSIFRLHDITGLRYEDGSTFIHFAAASNELPFLSNLLETSSIPVDSATQDGWTALHVAVAGGNPDALALLLAYGADPDRIFPYPQAGHRPLHFSVLQERTDIIDVLIQGGADINAPTAQGHTALHLCFAREGKTECLELLIDNGANVNAGGPDGSVLREAVMWEHEAGVVALLKAGAHADEDENLLHIAARGRSEKIMKALLDHGLDVNKRDNETQHTAAIEATIYQRTKMLELLYQRGADLSVLQEFRFFLRPREDGSTDRLSVWVGRENTLSAQELNKSLKDDEKGWTEWEPIREKRCGVYCDGCEMFIRGAYFHCSVCNEDNFDLCQECVGCGITCHGDGHQLTKRNV